MTSLVQRCRTVALAVAFQAIAGMTFAATCPPPAEFAARLNTLPTPDDYAALGDYFGERNQYDCAAQAWSSAFELEPQSAKYSYLLGLSLFFAGQTQSSADALHKSINLNPGSLQAHLLLATVLEKLGRNQEALSEWHTALSIDPNSRPALDGVAKSLLALNDYASVIQLLMSVARDENLALDLAIAYDHTGSLEKAVAILNAALAEAPSSLQLANSLALAYLKLDHHQDAETLLAKQYQLHPGDLETQIDYLRILVINEDREKAQPLGKTVLVAAPHDFDALYLNGLLERLNGDFAAAKDHLQEAAQLNPTHANCRYVLGLSLARLHQPAEAKVQLEKAIELGWNGPEIRYELANVDRALGQTDLAAQQMKLYQQASHSKEERTLAVSKEAQADHEMAAGDHKSAVAHYREASEAWPDNPLLSYKLALALDADGQVSEERNVLDKTARAYPKLAKVQQQLGVLAARAGDQPSAEQFFRLAVGADPNMTDAWISLATTLAAESKSSAAKEAASHALSLEPNNAQAQAVAQNLSRTDAQSKGQP